ncbi:MAG: hypothetical protein ALECFALPRED_008776 [Alectoria fallacina]|uniref:FAD-binding PCMH-type domain-containing protein n=1 Tax=Alectoria fallacina TaxID=1903189 RepID=A0A8H3J4N4_9LECA|nr:MAG: hypothetical protein ALECFALPRED_008776 [Alectoria fallacina]
MSLHQVKYCNKYDLSFLVQSRGNGWADTFHLGNCGFLIDISGLNKISFNSNKTQATIQGGALVQDMINAAFGNNTRFATPTCNCLGYLGAFLGGGITREMGLYGAGVDQIVSVNLVTASGQALQVDQTHNPDLWYAIRGAGANFGIVTSAIIKAYPIPQALNIAWEGAVTFADEKLESLIQAIHDLDLKPHMEIDFLFSTSGPPTYTPMITAIPFFLGNASAAEAAFAPILKVGPTSNGATELPYTEWGAFTASFCEKGERKPVYGVSLARQGLDAEIWRSVYDEYKGFVAAYPEAANSTILAEYYPIQKQVAIGSATSSYPFRDIPVHVAVIPLYANSSLDAAANAYGSRVRDLLRATDGLARNST